MQIFKPNLGYLAWGEDPCVRRLGFQKHFAFTVPKKTRKRTPRSSPRRTEHGGRGQHCPSGSLHPSFMASDECFYNLGTQSGVLSVTWAPSAAISVTEELARALPSLVASQCREECKGRLVVESLTQRPIAPSMYHQEFLLPGPLLYFTPSGYSVIDFKEKVATTAFWRKLHPLGGHSWSQCGLDGNPQHPAAPLPVHQRIAPQPAAYLGCMGRENRFLLPVLLP